MFKKIDLALFKICEFLIMREVKKSKYRKHKFNVENEWYIFEFVSLCGCVLITFCQYVLKGEVLLAFFVCVGWLLIVAHRGYTTFVSHKKDSEYYDWLWLQRKNPEVYKIVKDSCEVAFKEFYGMRKKYIILQGILFIGVLFVMLLSGSSIVGWWVVFSFILNFITLYTHFVFDFDEPNQKRKVKETLTEVVMQEIKRLTGQFAPQPI